MTQWGMLLLCAYIALGATRRLTWRKSGHIALLVTVLVVAGAFFSYSSRTPTDQYIPSIDATVYATGAQVEPPPTQGSGATPTIENLSGVKAATWSTTDHSTSGLGTGSDSSDDGGAG